MEILTNLDVAKDYSISLFNIKGEKVLTEHIRNKPSFVIEKDLLKGFYYIVIAHRNEVKTKTITV